MSARAAHAGAVLRAPARALLLEHVGRALGRYWSAGVAPVQRLPIGEAAFPGSYQPLELAMVEMPQWARRHAVDGCLAVPVEACRAPGDRAWDRVDWWLAAFLLLECWHERWWEQEHGPIHSYSHRLRGWDQRVWSHAWVNRIALFLRAWAAREAGVDEERLLGALPGASIVLTHDVDALRKTLPIRLKQSLFLLFNAWRLAARGHWGPAAARVNQAGAFLFRPDSWSGVLAATCALEMDSGLRSRFHFYADDRRKNLTRWLFDPGYQVGEPGLSQEIRAMAARGFSIGLHLSFDAWRSAQLARQQRARLESVAGSPVLNARQHWLRFSWSDTWAAQSQAGLTQDTTLMFNDRPGFRAAAALQWAPWDGRSGTAHTLTVLPTLLMDSHLYDYQPLQREERSRSIGHWLDELAAVGGQCAVLWHPHTLSQDYGWRDGLDELIAQMGRRSICGVL